MLTLLASFSQHCFYFSWVNTLTLQLHRPRISSWQASQVLGLQTGTAVPDCNILHPHLGVFSHSCYQLLLQSQSTSTKFSALHTHSQTGPSKVASLSPSCEPMSPTVPTNQTGAATGLCPLVTQVTSSFHFYFFFESLSPYKRGRVNTLSREREQGVEHAFCNLYQGTMGS